MIGLKLGHVTCNPWLAVEKLFGARLDSIAHPARLPKKGCPCILEGPLVLKAHVECTSTSRPKSYLYIYVFTST